jgi:ElaB/YqjD/DUF883 family membrane-anchored ribosome-binding protein
MCNGFSGFLHKNGTVYFIEPDDHGDISHHDVLERISEKLKNDADLVAFEFSNWTIKSFLWDTDEIPDWASKQKCVEIFKRVKPIWDEYNKVRDQARAEYNKVRDQAQAEYHNVRYQAWSEYNKVRDQARAEYDNVCDQAQAEYHNVRDQAQAEYNKVRYQAWSEYHNVCDQAQKIMIKKLSKIDGYLVP